LINPRPVEAKPIAALFGRRQFIDVEVKLAADGEVTVIEIPVGPGPGTPLKISLK
jgi:hypothetical protein